MELMGVETELTKEAARTRERASDGIDTNEATR